MPATFSARRPERLRKLLLGVVLCVGVFPALLVLAALFWFRGHAPWELVRTKPLEFVGPWMHACLASLSGHSATASTASGVGWTRLAGRFASAMFKGMTPVFTLFTCLGVASWWSTWKRREHQAMFYTVLFFLLAISIHLSAAQETSSRYFLPVVLVMSPFAALGLLACSAQLLRWAESGRWNLNATRLAALLPLLFFGIFSVGNVVLCDYRQRGGQADLGRWTHNEFGPAPALLGPVGVTQVVAYYSQGQCKLFDLDVDDQVIGDVLRQGSFDMVLLPDNHETSQGRCELLRALCEASLGVISHDLRHADRPEPSWRGAELVVGPTAQIGLDGAVTVVAHDHVAHPENGEQQQRHQRRQAPSLSFQRAISAQRTSCAEQASRPKAAKGLSRSTTGRK